MKTAISTIIAATLALCAIPAPAEDAAETDKNQVIEITATELRKKLKGDWKAKDRPALIDLRSAKEYADGRVTGSRRLDTEADDFDSKIARLDRRRTYVVYCRDGSTSAKVVAALKDQNFRKIYLLKGGWEAYEALISGRRKAHTKAN